MKRIIIVMVAIGLLTVATCCIVPNNNNAIGKYPLEAEFYIPASDGGWGNTIILVVHENERVQFITGGFYLCDGRWTLVHKDMESAEYSIKYSNDDHKYYLKIRNDGTATYTKDYTPLSSGFVYYDRDQEDVVYQGTWKRVKDPNP